MYFEFDDFYVDLINSNDLGSVVDLYNSNKSFLINHIGKENINLEWVSKELSIMKDEGFYSCKVVQI